MTDRHSASSALEILVLLNDSSLYECFHNTTTNSNNLQLCMIYRWYMSWQQAASGALMFSGVRGTLP